MAASIFVEFEKKESAEKAIEKSDELTYEGETLSVSLGLEGRAHQSFDKFVWCPYFDRPWIR